MGIIKGSYGGIGFSIQPSGEAGLPVVEIDGYEKIELNAWQIVDAAIYELGIDGNDTYRTCEAVHYEFNCLPILNSPLKCNVCGERFGKEPPKFCCGCGRKIILKRR